jgi:hypothetical protein
MLAQGRSNGDVMLGAIRKRDIVAHPLVTIECFGWRVFVRALTAGRDVTFLSLLAETGSLQAAQPKVPELVDRCVSLELTAKAIYEALARKFADVQPALASFLRTLAKQESGHAELLELCRAAAERGDWDEPHFAPWRDSVPRLERQLRAVQASLDECGDLSAALQLVIQVESSELDNVFDGIVAASDSEFVRKIQIFQKAGARHVSYLCNTITALDPSLADQCKAVRARHASGSSDS